MKTFLAVTFVVGLLSAPAWAEDLPDNEMDDGLNLLEEGARMFLRGLMTEMEPTIEGLRENFEELGPAFGEFAQSVGPVFADLLDQVDDLSNYQAPEILPNGDIIMRRKPDAPIWVPQEDGAEIEI